MSFAGNRSSFVFVVVGSLGTLGLVGCSGSPGSGGSGGSQGAEVGAGGAPSAQSFCSSFCDHVTQCDESQSAPTCASSCSDDLAALLPKMRSDVVESMQGCLSSADCAHVLGANVVEGCEQLAAASAAISAAGATFCSSWANAGEKCNSSIDQAACATTIKIYDDATIAEASACLGDPCNQIFACVDAALGFTGTSASATSSGPTDAGSGSPVATPANAPFLGSWEATNGTTLYECNGTSSTAADGDVITITSGYSDAQVLVTLQGGCRLMGDVASKTLLEISGQTCADNGIEYEGSMTIDVAGRTGAWQLLGTESLMLGQTYATCTWSTNDQRTWR